MKTFFDVGRNEVVVNRCELDGKLFGFWMDRIVPPSELVQNVVTEVREIKLEVEVE